MELSNYNSKFSIQNKIGRILWNICYPILFRPFSFRFCKHWRHIILRLFGAKVAKTAHIYASVKIWAPWNLEIGEHSCLGPNVDCYNQGKITIGNNTVISQKSYLCASTHDYKQSSFPLICKPIIIGNSVWVAADSFIGPGITIGDGAIVGARSAVFKNVEPSTIVGGNPAKFIKYK